MPPFGMYVVMERRSAVPRVPVNSSPTAKRSRTSQNDVGATRESCYRVWQRRFYPFNVYSERKRLEKLNYMHGKPVKRGLVSSPDQWPWSSFRFYYLTDSSILSMDRLI